MDPVPDRISFPGAEEDTLKYWEEIDAFQESVRRSVGKPEYTFYDGPPFATGLPHYGHILAGTIKDTVTRYAHQTGHHVERRFGWDCHGLPIEFEIDKELGIKTKEDVMELGIPKYNAACRGIVMRYSGEWEKIVTRLGRWIDFKNDYKTMDLDFMESVWWVFSELYKKNLVYRGCKVMPYSTACTTPLSNFEAGMNYKDVDDPEVYVTFPIVGRENEHFIAWTTTPWTLPSNLALCVNEKESYVTVEDSKRNKKFVIMEARLEALYPTPKKKKGKEAPAPTHKVINKCLGKDLVGLQYEPLFTNFVETFGPNGAFKVVSDEYVKSDSGTGVVHQAPAFGEDDFRVCMANGIILKGGALPCPVDESGRFTVDVPDFSGRYIKDCDKEITEKLKAAGRVFQSGVVHHSYPFCWRSDKPLIYKAIPSWFVRVEEVRERLLKNCMDTYWVPSSIRDGRFYNWLEKARDWAVSRNRYWGTPLPLWVSEDFEEVVCISSIDELEKLSGVRVNDLHRETVDSITIPSKMGKGTLRRVEEVFDCWFESGSMPYAQVHYPFENKERFEKGFPAHFIAEGIDQTRGWFYTLLVLSTCLFDKPSFQNLIVNGLVLAEDGKKMSKRLRNYPDPSKVVHEYGADALRMYLINSPVVRADDLRFQEMGVMNVLKDMLLPWFNAYRFLVISTIRRQERIGTPFQPDFSKASSSKNVMDSWILAKVNHLVKYVQEEMKLYHLYTVLPHLVAFIEELTNWYLRMNRTRLKGNLGEEEADSAINTLFDVIVTLTRTMAPFTPFFTEYIYQNLKKVLPEEVRQESVHFTDFPSVRTEVLNDEVVSAVDLLQTSVNHGRVARERRVLPLKFPLKKAFVVLKDDASVELLKKYGLEKYIAEELNVRELELTTEADRFITLKATPVHKRLGARLRKDVKAVQAAVAQLTSAQVAQYQKDGKIEICGHTLDSEDLVVVNTFSGDKNRYEGEWDSKIMVVIDVEEDEELRFEGVLRAVASHTQRLRKNSGVQVEDEIEIYFDLKGNQKLQPIAQKTRFVENILGRPFLSIEQAAKQRYTIAFTEFSPDSKFPEEKMVVHLVRSNFVVDPEALKAKYPDITPAIVETVQNFLSTASQPLLQKELEETKQIRRLLNDREIVLTLNDTVYLNNAQYVRK